MQKVDDVVSAIKFLEKHDIYRHNVASISIAKLGAMVAHGLGGKKVSVTPDDFLPFDTRKINKENGVSDQSLKVLRKLMRTRRLNARLVSTMANEIKMASMRDDD